MKKELNEKKLIPDKPEKKLITKQVEPAPETKKLVFNKKTDKTDEKPASKLLMKPKAKQEAKAD